MVAVSQPAYFNIQEFTDLGELAAGGRIYTYEAGTTTFKAAYTESTGTTTHTYTADGTGLPDGQYIALNARGELPAPLYIADGNYDITYKTAAGATVWTRNTRFRDVANTAARNITANDTLTTADHSKTVVITSAVTTAITVTLPDANTAGNGYTVTIVNNSGLAQTIARTTSGDTIDGTAANISILAGESIEITTNATVDGFLSKHAPRKAGASVIDYMTISQVVNVIVGLASVDVTAAIQRAHDAMPANGGTLEFPINGYYLLAVDGTYVNITKPNVTIKGSSGAWLVNPASDDAEVTTGDHYLNGFRITGNNCTISLNMRGCNNLWTPQAATDRLTMRDMTMLNMYISGLFIDDDPFDTLDVDGVVFDTSRDLASDSGNYQAISRSCAGDTALYGQHVRVSRCTFRGVAGGIDVQNVKNTSVTNGTRFIGCDFFTVKLTTSDTAVVEQNLYIDDSCTASGAAVDAASANRHLACTGGGRTTANYAQYGAFIQVFSGVAIAGYWEDFLNIGIAYLDGSRVDAVLDHSGIVMNNCGLSAISNPQGTVILHRSKLTDSAFYSSSAQIIRRLDIRGCRLIDSPIIITKRSVELGDMFRVIDNDITYGADNNGAIQFTDFGFDTGPTLIVDGNKVELTDSRTVAMNLSTSGSKGILKASNQYDGTITGGIMPNAYEPQTGAGPDNLYLYNQNNGEFTILKSANAGSTQYLIHDAVFTCPIGTVFHAMRSNATSGNTLIFTCTGGTINGQVTCELQTQYASVTLKKIAANTWIATAANGTVAFF